MVMGTVCLAIRLTVVEKGKWLDLLAEMVYCPGFIFRDKGEEAVEYSWSLMTSLSGGLE